MFFFISSLPVLAKTYDVHDDIPAASLKIPPLLVEKSVSTYIPSLEAGKTGLAVNLIYPVKPRYRAGAPIVVVVAGGNNGSGLSFTTHSSQQGFIEVRFAFPGSGLNEFKSGGIYDNRGLSSQKAFVDVLKFASGKICDNNGRYIDELLPIKPMTNNIGILGWGNGGNLATIVLTNFSDEVKFVNWLSLYESPIGDLFYPPNLGSQDELVRNNHYHIGSAATGKCLIDFKNLAYDPDAVRYSRNFYKGLSSEIKHGVVFYDENHNGKFDEMDEYAYNYTIDTGLDKQIYPPELCIAFEKNNIFIVAQKLYELKTGKKINNSKATSRINRPLSDKYTAQQKAYDEIMQSIMQKTRARSNNEKPVLGKPKKGKDEAVKEITPDKIRIPKPKNNINYHEPALIKQYKLNLIWPEQIAQADESIDFYKMRNASIYLPQLCVNMPSLMVMLVASVLDHRQIQEDHPHILLSYNALLESHPFWLKLNPEPVYIGKIASISTRTFPDVKPLTSIDSENITNYLEPEGIIPDYVFTEASISELADRYKFKNLSSPLTQTLVDEFQNKMLNNKVKPKN